MSAKPLTFEDFVAEHATEPMTARELWRTRRRDFEDWRRDVTEDDHDQREITGHDCYRCAAKDRRELLATLDAALAESEEPDGMDQAKAREFVEWRGTMVEVVD